MAKEQNFSHPPKGHFGLCAYDSVNDRWQVVHVDADGQLHIEIKAELPAGTKNIGDVDVVTMPTTTVQAAGGDKIFSFDGFVEEEVENLSLIADYNFVPGTAVPSGKIHLITIVCIMYLGTVPTYIRAAVVGLAGNVFLAQETTVVSNIWVIWSGQMYLQAGDYMAVEVVGATAGDDLFLRYAGVSMNAP